MKSQETLVKEFGDGAVEGSASHMFIERDTLYSYGRHFPLVVRRKEGGFLVNGDTYSSSTGIHQGHCFRLGPQIPFSALQTARINPKSLHVIAIRESTWNEIPAPTEEDPENVRHEHVLGATLIKYRGKYYLSSVDSEESSYGNYFLCRLPKKVASINAAFNSLTPNRIKRLRRQDKPYLRQGDWYFIPTELNTKDLPGPSKRSCPLRPNSRHIAAERRENGAVYVRGTVRHRVERFMPRQHKMVKLGKVWHEIVRNLAVASWSAAGGVD